jgi:hypothetical protein
MRSAQANSWRDSISKITRVKWTGGVAQWAESPLCKCEDEFKPQFQKTHKKREGKGNFLMNII